MKKTPKEIIDDLEILFQYDDYEEVVYPIIQNYFLDAIGKPDESQYAKSSTEKAYAILAEARAREAKNK